MPKKPKKQKEPKKHQVSPEGFKEAADRILSPLSPAEPGKEKEKDKPSGRIRRTNEQIAIDRIIETEPNPVWLLPLKVIFGVIAEVTNCEKVKKKVNKYAEDLCLPITQITSYYLPKLSPVHIMFFNALTAVGSVSFDIYRLVQEEKDERKKSNPDTGKERIGQEPSSQDSPTAK